MRNEKGDIDGWAGTRHDRNPEDPPSDYLGFSFGEIILSVSGKGISIEVDIKNCTCQVYKASVIEALNGIGPLTDSEHQKFMDAYTPVKLPVRDLYATLQGGRTGWFIRRAIKQGPKAPHQAYGAKTIQEYIEELGL